MSNPWAYNPYPTPVPQGTSWTFTETITGVNGESSPISVEVGETGNASVDAVASPPATVVQAPYGSVNFTITVAPNATPGPTALVVHAVDGNGTVHTDSAEFTITAPGPDFALQVQNRGDITLAPGQTGTLDVTISGSNGFNSPVQLAITPTVATVPDQQGATVVWQSSGLPVLTVQGPYPVVATVRLTMPPAVVGATTGSPQWWINATAGQPSAGSAYVHQSVLTVVVAATGGATFGLNVGSCAPVGVSGGRTVQVTVVPQNGETAPVTVTGVSLVTTFSETEVVSPPSQVSQYPYAPLTFTITDPGTSVPQQSVMQFLGIDAAGNQDLGEVTCQTSLPASAFSLSTNPASPLTINSGGASSVAVSIAPSNGFASDVQLSVVPVNASGTAVPPVTTWSGGAGSVTDVPAPYATQTLNILAPAAATPSAYQYRIVATSPNLADWNATLDISVNVVALSLGGFQLSASPGPTLNPGGSGQFTVSVQPASGETSPVTIVPSQGPGTVTPQQVTINPPYTASATFTVSTSTAQAPGTQSISLYGLDQAGHALATSTSYLVAGPPSSFTLQAIPSLVPLTPGSTGYSTLSISAVSGFTGQLTLAAVPQPADSTVGPPPVVQWNSGAAAGTVVDQLSAPYQPQSLVITVPPAATPGKYHYLLKGYSALAQPVEVSTNLWVEVQASLPQDGSSYTYASCGASCNYTNHGGPVITDPHIFLIFWGSEWAADKTGVDTSVKALFNSLAGSNYNAILGQYGVNNTAAVRGVYYDRFDDSAFSGAVTSGQMEQEVLRAASANNWSWDGNTLFVVMPSISHLVSGTDPAGRSGVCAFHQYSSGSQFAYVALPDYANTAYTSACVHGVASTAGLAMTNWASHEYVEAVTDPQVNAWRRTPGSQDAEITELADACESTGDQSKLPSGTPVLVQLVYDVNLKECRGEQTNGYWVTDNYGHVYAEGSASWFGDARNIHLNAPVSGMAATADGNGYWLTAQDGGVFSYGDAAFHGSLGSVTLNAAVFGIASTPDGGGYWLVAGDGGVFTFGDATFYGSMGGKQLNAEVTAITPTPDGGGYWLFAQDGGVFAFGDAIYWGNETDTSEAWFGLCSYPNGQGYLATAASGYAWPVGDAVNTWPNPYHHPNGASFAGVVTYDGIGAYILDSDGSVYAAGRAVNHGNATIASYADAAGLAIHP